MTAVLQLEALRARDVLAAARLHRAAFPGFFLSRLGEPFLAQFYRGFLNDPTAITVAATDQTGALRGVAVGTSEPAGFFARLLRRRWPGFVAASARAVLRDPAATSRLLRAVGYRGDTPPRISGALLSSICVDPQSRGQGVGGLLLEGWSREAAARGAATAFLTTDAVGNDAVNDFYRRHGWTVDAHFETHEGRPMLRYRRQLGGG